MTDAARADDSDFSPTYSGAQKGALFTLVVLFLLSLPGVGLTPNASFGGLSVSGITLPVIRLGLFFASVIYVYKFGVTWSQDALSYARRSIDLAGSTYLRVSDEIERVSAIYSRVDDALASMRVDAEAAISLKYSDKIGVDYDELGNVIEQRFADTLEAELNEPERVTGNFIGYKDNRYEWYVDHLWANHDQRLASMEYGNYRAKNILNWTIQGLKRGGEYSTSFVQTDAANKFASTYSLLSTELLPLIEEASKAMRKMRTDLFRTRNLSFARVAGDLAPVAVMTVIAWLHFAGTHWPLWPTLPAVLADWHWIEPVPIPR